MKLGIYTGTIYKDKDKTVECTLDITEKTSLDQDKVNKIYMSRHARCLNCAGCIKDDKRRS